MRLLLVSGSLREGSVNSAVVRTAAALAPDARVYGEMGELPPYSPDADREGAQLHPAVVSLRRELAGADAWLVCTPEYAGSLPGSFKNLLDWTVGGGETYGKPVAWINASSAAAPTGGRGAHAALRAVLTWTGAAIVEPACRRISVTRDQVGADGLIADTGVRAAIGGVLRSLVAGASAASALSADEVVRAADAAVLAALASGDAARLEGLLGETFLLAGRGGVVGRDTLLAAVADGQAVLDPPAGGEMVVRLYGPFAIVLGAAYTHVFELDGGAWRLVSAHGTPIGWTRSPARLSGDAEA